MHEHVLHTDTLNPTREEIDASFPHLHKHNTPTKRSEASEEEEKLKLNSQIPVLVEDIRFAVNNFGDVSLEKAAALDKLGRVVFKLGKYEELLELSYEIVAIKETLLGVDHVEVGAALRNIGTLTGKLGRLDECQRVFLRALYIHKLHYKQGSKEMAILLAKMHQYGLEEEVIKSEGMSYAEYQLSKKASESEEEERAEL